MVKPPERDCGHAAVAETIACFDYGRDKIEHCVKQLSNQQLWWRPRDEMNSIANLLLHLSGNLRQWIISGVGDAPDVRDRPGEFAARSGPGRDVLWAELQSVLEDVRRVLQEIPPSELLTAKRVQGFEVSKMHAMLHAVTHFQGHVQEIICLTRQQLGADYRFDWQPTTPEEGA